MREYGDRSYEAEEEASNWKAELTTMNSMQLAAKGHKRGFESANFEDAKLILQRAMRDHKDYF
ncbi:hypothetical protein [Enterobacter roggenkampii]|uniref:hypothetical protein n=1 Tax=Enterobacter roggenkampii TaxID=1812935 RepID=UPI001AE0407C|nr:hypothetical protein [Enterobacter roggenkampii]